MKPDIFIRDAKKGEGKRIAELILQAWPVDEFLAADPSMTYEKLRDMIAAVVESEQTIYSYENTMVAFIMDDNTGMEMIIGTLCGYDGADYIRLKQPILEVIGYDSDFARTIETEAGEFYLDSVGVDPQYRGLGTATLLFNAMISKAAVLGHKTVGLIVDIDKPLAEKLYRRLGFEHSGYRSFFSHQMKHMTRNI